MPQLRGVFTVYFGPLDRKCVLLCDTVWQNNFEGCLFWRQSMWHNSERRPLGRKCVLRSTQVRWGKPLCDESGDISPGDINHRKQQEDFGNMDFRILNRIMPFLSLTGEEEIL